MWAGMLTVHFYAPAPSCKSDYNTWLHLRGVPSIPSLMAGSAHTVAVMMPIGETELVSHVKIAFTDSCMLRTGEGLGDDSHFVSNNYSSPKIQPLSSAGCCSLTLTYLTRWHQSQQDHHTQGLGPQRLALVPERIQFFFRRERTVGFSSQCIFFCEFGTGFGGS